MKNEVDVLGSPSLIVHTVSEDVKQHLTKKPVTTRNAWRTGRSAKTSRECDQLHPSIHFNSSHCHHRDTHVLNQRHPSSP